VSVCERERGESERGHDAPALGERERCERVRCVCVRERREREKEREGVCERDR